MNKHIRRTAAMLSLIIMVGACFASCNRGKISTPDGSSTSNDDQLNGTSGVGGELVAPDTAPSVTTAATPQTGNYVSGSENASITFGDTANGTVATPDSGSSSTTESDASEVNTHNSPFVSVSGSGVAKEGNTFTVTSAGSYLFSGSISDGQIIVDTTDEGKVELILNGLSLSSSTGPAILIKSAPKKVVITTVEGSVNLLSDGTDYVVPDEEQTEDGLYPNACIYACDDLEFAGAGALYITGNADKGVNTKDDLKIKSGMVMVTSVGVGMRGNDSVEISGGEITVTAGGDGIKSTNIEKEGKGYVAITGGTLYITATGDGLAAATDLTFTSGTAVITTKDADSSSLSTATTSTDSLLGDGNIISVDTLRGPGGMMGEGNSQKSTISAKGLKAASTLTVSGGKITITSADDGIHSNDTVVISDGSIYISANDDGVHADNNLTIGGGTLEVAKSYEGLEANQITISGGHNRVHASDDGTNANGGSSMGMGGMGGGWWGQSSGSSSSDSDQSDPLLTITGGYTVVYADGDGVDSNGNIVMTGGTMLVYGPTNNGNGAIDYGDGSYNMTISGGVFLAVGSSGMADTAQNNGQAVLAAYTGGTIYANTLIGIKNADGDMIAAFELPKAISSIVYSSPALTAGDTYTIVYGGTAGEASDGVVDPSAYTGYSEMGSVEAY